MEAIKYPFLDLGKVNEPYMDGIREAVERYEGVMEVESRDGIFAEYHAACVTVKFYIV